MTIVSRLVIAAAFASFATSTVSAAPGDPDIGTKKYGISNDVKMDIVAPGNLQPMNAVVRQEKNAVVLSIVEGGTTPAKAVEIDHGTCKQLGPAQCKLPPFRGGQYQATVKNANLEQLQDGQHSVVVVGSDGNKRSTYACGALDEPSFFRH